MKKISNFRSQKDIPEGMALIPEGPFLIGSPENGRVDSQPRHTVHLNAFYIDKHPVTFEEYDRFCVSTGRPLADDEGMGRGKHPVINVSWFDAVDYAVWVGKRLPTEAEWEKAARGGTSTYYFWTDDFYGAGGGDYLWYKDNAGMELHPVGLKRPNPFGLYDMMGLVYEWCSDWYAKDYYKITPETNPKGPIEGDDRDDRLEMPVTGYYRKVKRGGSWVSEFDVMSSDCRGDMHPGLISPGTGFRCVKDVSSMDLQNLGLKRPGIPKWILRKSPGWVQVVHSYSDLYKENQVWGPFLDLAKFLATSPYGRFTYPVTSMGTLFIAQTEEFVSDQNILKIDYVPTQNLFILEYLETPPGTTKRKHWTMACAPHEVYTGVEHFFDLQKWFTTPPKTGNFLNEVDHRMVLVPEGPFLMGAMRTEEEYWDRPQREVYLSAFYIDPYPVTFDEYDKFCVATGRRLPDSMGQPRGKYPVTDISWSDAYFFAIWAGKRLPTDAEWEKAARGGTTAVYFWGDDPSKADEYAWYKANSGGKTHPVGEKKPNPIGLYDMAGNVWEMCSDHENGHYYLHSPRRDPKGPAEADWEPVNIMRGGSWKDDPYAMVASHSEGHCGRQNFIGFRCVRDA